MLHETMNMNRKVFILSVPFKELLKTLAINLRTCRHLFTRIQS